MNQKFYEKDWSFLKITSAEKKLLDESLDCIGPTDGWGKLGRRQPKLSDFSCSAMFSGCDFERVECKVTAKSEIDDLSCCFSVYCKLRKMPKRYLNDRRAGITKPFSQYKWGVRECNEIELEFRMNPALMNRALHGVCYSYYDCIKNCKSWKISKIYEWKR